jgi:asparagine synthase (glutamine-hydrolysing)
MCGIAGLWNLSGGDIATVENTAKRMASALEHRGPDDAGVWSDAAAGLALSHRRLSILDLSEAGHQPMLSASKRFVLSYNGELYNYRELRKELEKEGVRFRTECDTEVLLEALATWGVKEALVRFNGMYAFALWDKKERRLYLARDPFGIKPLYVGAIKGKIAFGSELNALRKVSTAALPIERAALVEYFRYGFVPAPLSIYSQVFKVMPGTVLTISARDAALPEGFVQRAPFNFPDVHCAVHEHWSLEQEYVRGRAKPLKLTFDNAVEELESLLSRAVKRQRVSDVPVGAFLSSGIDSSTIVALLRKADAQPVRTYTIGVEDSKLNEAEQAQEIAAHLGTQHTTRMLSESEVRDAIGQLGRVYDEPFADSSQIPTLLVSRLAAEDVKVVLTGDGGDEMFGGYNRHVHGLALWQAFRSIPASAKTGLIALSSSSLMTSLDGILEKTVSLLFSEMNHRSFANLREKAATIAESESVAELYRNLISHARAPARYVDGIESGADVSAIEGLDGLRLLMALDGTHYLPNDILTKVDRATMACSIEARVPFLDIDVARFAARLPDDFLVQRKTGKRILRSVLKRHLPEKMVDRPKRGFAVPIGEWLRGPLRAWAKETIDAAAKKYPTLLRWDLIAADIDAFQVGRQERAEWVWDVVRLADWLNCH